LDEAIGARGQALLAVSGGTTPVAMFEALARAEIAWDHVTVTLVDERFVPPSSDRSNAKLVRDRLLQGAAASARFIPLYSPAPSVEEAAGAADAALNRLDLPFDVVVLGMGGDGHTASFFPDGAELDKALDARTQRRVVAVNAASAGEPRLTLTLPPIASARFIALHIEGAEKADVLAQALAKGSTLPIRRVIDAGETPVEIFWAP
ncbi:MAG: 6-phosphogluconolactonase, partial [Mesorhizobium sp.]